MLECGSESHFNPTNTLMLLCNNVPIIATTSRLETSVCVWRFTAVSSSVIISRQERAVEDTRLQVKPDTFTDYLK